MRIQASKAAILGGVFAASVVVGLVVAGRAVFPEADAGAGPSGVPSLSPTPGGTWPGPPSPSPSAPQTPSAQDFCGLVDEMTAYEDEYMAHAPYQWITDFQDGEVPGDDPELMNAIHAWGQYVLDEMETRASYAERLAAVVDDPDLVADFEHIAMEQRLSDAKRARVALDAATGEEYLEAKNALYSDPELLALSEESVPVSERVGQYIRAVCDDGRFGNPDPEEHPARDDADVIGRGIANNLRDWEAEGSSPPMVTASGGVYYLDGVAIGEQSPGVTLVSASFFGSDEWCVDVVSQDDPLDAWSVSPRYGVWQGTCALLEF